MWFKAEGKCAENRSKHKVYVSLRRHFLGGALLYFRTYAKLCGRGAKPKTVQEYGKAKQQSQRLFCVSPVFKFHGHI